MLPNSPCSAQEPWGIHSARSGSRSVLLATDHDDVVVDAWRQRMPRPSLHMPFHDHVGCRLAGKWPEALRNAGIVFVAVSSSGLERVLCQLRAWARRTRSGS